MTRFLRTVMPGIVASLLLLPAAAQAQLTPADVVVLVNRRSADSVKVAKRYAELRNIPADRVLEFDLPAVKELPREIYDTFRKELRAELTSRKLDGARCLVTTYGFPYRVGNKVMSAADRDKQKEADTEATKALTEIRNLAAELRKIAGAPPPKDDPAPPTSADFQKVLGEFQGALTAAQGALGKVPAGPEQQLARQTLERCFVQFGGLAELSGNLQRKIQAGQGSEQDRLLLAGAQGELRGLETGMQVLATLPAGPQRDLAERTLLLRQNGWVGVARLAVNRREAVGSDESSASLDSELSLLWWDEYQLRRWAFNPLAHRFDKAPPQFRRDRVVMTARLEGPTVEHTIRMMEDAVAVEAAGLKGKVYIDARGLKAQPDGSGGYGEYDEALRRLAGFLQQKTSLPVVLDDKPELFGKDSCPDAAVYCGWYSVRNYVDAFAWVKGSVGYHIASFEATDLQGEKSNEWCRQMLLRGVTATLGPTAEPYLISFPRPDEFFPLLMTGKYTLAECYWRTVVLTSWMNVLLGDPLYNPFKAKPALGESDLPEGLAPGPQWARQGK